MVGDGVGKSSVAGGDVVRETCFTIMVGDGESSTDNGLEHAQQARMKTNTLPIQQDHGQFRILTSIRTSVRSKTFWRRLTTACRGAGVSSTAGYSSVPIIQLLRVIPPHRWPGLAGSPVSSRRSRVSPSRNLDLAGQPNTACPASEARRGPRSPFGDSWTLRGSRRLFIPRA
jgi:hypothetical protein